MKIKVVRSFMSNGSQVAVGTVMDLEDQAGRQLIWSGKAERTDEAPAPSGPMTTESADGLVSGKRRKTSGE